MAIEVQQTGSAEYGRWLKSLIVGEPGSGKTLISSTFPEPFYASAEGGLMSIADRGIPFTKITKSEQLFEVKKMLEHDAAGREALFGYPVSTIVVDTIDEVQRIMSRERLKEKKQDHMTYQDWGWLREQMTSLTSGLRNLDLNVVFTCHVKTEKDDELGSVRYRPALQGQFAEDVPGYFDLALLLTNRIKTKVVNNQTHPVVERWLQTYPDLQHSWIKDRSGKLPQELAVNFEDDYQRMADLIFADMDRLLKQQVHIAKEETKETVEELEQGSATQVDEPATITANDIEVVNTETLGYTCEECSEVFTDKNQATLSHIRVRRTLCKPCYKAAQATKKGK